MAGQHEVRLKPDTTNLGVTNGEDVKEYYFYLDNTPTHSYARMLYKYPQVAYPYAALVEENRRRGPGAPEFELFDAIGDAMREGRYFDVFIEYAKAGPEDILCRVRAVNRGPDPAPIHILPQLWFRNTHYLFPQLTARANEHRCGGCACGDTRPTSARYVGRVSRSAPAEGLKRHSLFRSGQHARTRSPHAGAQPHDFVRSHVLAGFRRDRQIADTAGKLPSI